MVRALGLILALAVAGCQTTAPSAEIVQAPGMASIQVTRSNDLMYVAASASVTVNGQSVASLGRGERYVGVVRPGAVTVGAHAVTMPGTYSVRFNAQPGKTYRFVVSPRGESYMPSLVGGVIGSAIDAAVNENAGAFKIAAE